MNSFERHLTLWVQLCIGAGIALGQCAPGLFQTIGHLEVAQVNLPVGLLIWVMIIPMLLKVVVGVLIEVPVMLLVVRAVNRSRGWYERSCDPRLPPSLDKTRNMNPTP